MRRDCTNVQSGCTIREHETFNLFNTFNWGLPSTILEGATFGRITTMDGDSANHAVWHQVRVLVVYSLLVQEKRSCAG